MPTSPNSGRASRRGTNLLAVVVLSLALLQSSCSLRTYPPIKYLPLLGK